MNRIITPAATKIWAAMATETFIRWVLQTSLIVQVRILAMQKPKRRPDMMNLWFRRRLIWRMVMCVTAPITKRTRKIEVIGSSRVFVGDPPSPAVVGRYGP